MKILYDYKQPYGITLEIINDDDLLKGEFIVEGLSDHGLKKGAYNSTCTLEIIERNIKPIKKQSP